MGQLVPLNFVNSGDDIKSGLGPGVVRSQAFFFYICSFEHPDTEQVDSGPYDDFPSDVKSTQENLSSGQGAEVQRDLADVSP